MGAFPAITPPSQKTFDLDANMALSGPLRRCTRIQPQRSALQSLSSTTSLSVLRLFRVVFVVEVPLIRLLSSPLAVEMPRLARVVSDEAQSSSDKSRKGPHHLPCLGHHSHRNLRRLEQNHGQTVEPIGNRGSVVAWSLSYVSEGTTGGRYLYRSGPRQITDKVTRNSQRTTQSQTSNIPISTLSSPNLTNRQNARHRHCPLPQRARC